MDRQSRALAAIYDGATRRGGSPSISQSACDHSIPVTDLGPPRDIRGPAHRGDGKIWAEQRIERRPPKLHVACLTFNAEHERGADRLPVTPQGTATDEAAVLADVPGMAVLGPSTNDPA
jgi:hypothetical protein